MISINIFNKVASPVQESMLSTEHFEEMKMVNGFKEKIETNVLQNELSPSGYRNYRVITDEIYDQRVRVKGEVIDQVIMQELYQAYSDEKNNNNRLITLCRKEDAFKVKNIFENKFNLKYEQHVFDLLKIINESTDVRSAKFNVKIETVNSITMKGTNVNSTNYYERMLNSGQLTGVIVSYDMADQTVTFRISTEGSILLYSSLSEYQILDLVDELLEI